MTKLRTPTTIEDALHQISVQVPGGFEAMAKVCPPSLDRDCVGAGIVRAWGDPDRRERFPFDAIVPLDLLYAEHGGIGAPLFELLEYLRHEAHATRFSEGRELAEATIDVAKESGDAVAALIAASQPGATPEQKQRARKELAELDAAIGRVAPKLKPETEAPT